MTSRRTTWIVVAVALLALAAGLALALRHFSSGGPGGSAAPFFAEAFPDLHGRVEPMSRWEGGLVVVNFWATWCPPCVEEMPDLQRIHDDYASRGVTVVGLGIDAPASLRRFRDEHRLTMPLYAAGAAGSEVGRALGNASAALPYTVLIGRDGRIVRARLGQIKPAELRGWLDAQLGSRAG
jgi:peroxiredoxin